jgi:hypothetical protein
MYSPETVVAIDKQQSIVTLGDIRWGDDPSF